MSFVLAHDATTAEFNTLPSGLAAGYTTGPGIAWTPQQWAEKPDAIRICQNPGATDTTADVLDVESGAATPGDCARWFQDAKANYDAVTRPGQRWPAIYTSLSNVTNVANALVSGGIRTNGPALWVALWGLTIAQAEAKITNQQPYPIIGIQYNDGPNFDYDVFLESWVTTVSHRTPPPPVEVSVPDVLNLDGTEAHAALEKVGLSYASTVIPHEPLAVTQVPSAGVKVPKGTVVKLVFK